MLQPSQSPRAVVADATGSTRSLALGAVTRRAVVWARSTRATRSCGAIAPQGGDSNDERHLRQQLQQVERHLRQQLQHASDSLRTVQTLLGDIIGVPLPDLRPPEQRQQRRPLQYVYQDAHTQAIVMCTWAAARQAMIRVRYFLDGDAGAMHPAGGGWRPVKRQAHDGGLAQECRPVRRGCSTPPPLGLTPASFEELCACTGCGAPVFVPLSRGRSSAATCADARARQGDNRPPYRLHCISGVASLSLCDCVTVPADCSERGLG